MKTHTKNGKSRLGGYLTAAVTVGSLASTSHAAVVTLNVSSFDGVNAGLDPGGLATVNLGDLNPLLAGSFRVYNKFVDADYYTFTGLNFFGGATMAINGGYASPKNFGPAGVVDGSSTFSDGNGFEQSFAYSDYSANISADRFGSGSYIGFRSINGANTYYGYLEVTWDSAAEEFNVLSGAFESTPGVAITTPIPEPSAAVLSLGALAAGAFIRRRKQAA